MLAAAAVAGLAASTEIKVTPLVTPQGRVVASVAAPEAFNADLRTVVGSGLLVTLTFVAELKRPATFWFDKTVGTTTVTATLKFDNVTREYQVSRQQDGHVVFAQRTHDEETMRSWLTQFDRMPIETRDALEVNADYFVQVKLHVSPRRAFSFWPWGRNDGSGRSADFPFIR